MVVLNGLVGDEIEEAFAGRVSRDGGWDGGGPAEYDDGDEEEHGGEE